MLRWRWEVCHCSGPVPPRTTSLPRYIGDGRAGQVRDSLHIELAEREIKRRLGGGGGGEGRGSERVTFDVVPFGVFFSFSVQPHPHSDVRHAPAVEYTPLLGNSYLFFATVPSQMAQGRILWVTVSGEVSKCSNCDDCFTLNYCTSAGVRVGGAVYIYFWRVRSAEKICHDPIYLHRGRHLLLRLVGSILPYPACHALGHIRSID